MPELPEVEAARRAVHDHCLGKKIKSAVVADDPKVIDGVTVSDFEAALVGKTIVAALRKGKNMWLQLDSPPFPSFQFGMAGAVYIKGVAVTKYKRSAVKESEEWPSKYSKVFIEQLIGGVLVKLENGVELSFTDKRRFARVRLLKDPATVAPISELGPDALLEPMTVKEFTEALSKKKTVIKALLLDQSFMAGIGNWIADEVLYQARIHPQEVAANLSKESCANLHKCIKEVIEKAVEVGADSSQYPSDWIFHSREKKPGKAFVDGKKIEFITAGGRTTAYVPELQQNSSGDAKASGKPKKQIPKRKKGSSSDEDGPESGEEEGGESVKPKKMQKPDGGRARKSSVQEKSKDSEEGSDEDEDDGGGKRKVTKKMAEKKQAPKTTAKKGNQAAAENNAKRNSRVKK